MTTAPATGPDQTWARSVVLVPAIVAFVVAAGCTFLAMVFGGLANFNDVSTLTAAQQRWLAAGPIGECALGVAALVLLALGLRFAARRRNAGIAALVIIPLAVGWLLLTAFLGGL